MAPDKTEKGKDGAGAEQLPWLTRLLLCCELKGWIGADTSHGTPLKREGSLSPSQPPWGDSAEELAGVCPGKFLSGWSVQTVALFWGAALLSPGVQSLPAVSAELCQRAGAEFSFFFLFPFGVTLARGFNSSPKAVLLDPTDGCGVRAMCPFLALIQKPARAGGGEKSNTEPVPPQNPDPLPASWPAQKAPAAMPVSSSFKAGSSRRWGGLGAAAGLGHGGHAAF